MFILHKGIVSLSQRSHLQPPRLQRRAHRDFFFFLPNFSPPGFFFFFEWGWGGNTRIEPKPQFPQRVLEPKKQSRRGRRCHLKAGPARGSQPSPAEGGGSAATEATSADPGRRPQTCGADCSCPWVVQPRTRWLEGGRSAGSWSPAPTGSPWLLFLCVKIPPPAPASLLAFPGSVSLHPSSSLAPQILLPAPPRTQFSPQRHLCTSASLCHILKPPRSWGGPFSHPSISRMYPQGRHPVSTETPISGCRRWGPGRGLLPAVALELTLVSFPTLPLRPRCSLASLSSSQYWKSVTGSKRNSSFFKLSTTGEGALVLGPGKPHGGERGLLEGRGF